MYLKKEELLMINGGSKIGFAAIAGGIITILIGIIDGYFRPLKCNK